MAWLNIPVSKLKEQYQQAKDEKIRKYYVKRIADHEKKLTQKRTALRDELITHILLFDALYILEDDTGKPYTKETLAEMTTDELETYYTQLLQEMERDIGTPD